MGLGAGSYLLGNIWKANLLPEAMGATAARKRFILISNGNGILQRQFTFTARSETDFDMTPVFTETMGALKNQLVVAHKFYNPHDRALHGNQWATFSVMPSSNQSGEKRGPPGGISIDRFLAGKIGAKDAFQSTAQGIAEGSNVLCLSSDGVNRPFPAIGNPVKAYETFFGAGATAGTDANKLLAQDKSLLDFIAADVTRMNARLAGTEKAKLDQYTTSLRGVERQLKELAMARGGCTQPAKPLAEANKSSLNPAVVEAHIDVAFAAQMCGLTRVSHISILGMEGPHNSYGWLGDTMGHHNQHHGNNFEMLNKIDTFILGNVARMATKLQGVPEAFGGGMGTMLDNSLVVHINCCGGTHHNGQDTHPIITLGKAGGAMKTGRYLTFPTKKHCIGDAFVSFANAMDVPITTFGDPMHTKGPLPGYLG